MRERQRSMRGSEEVFHFFCLMFFVVKRIFENVCVTLVSNWTFVVPNSKEAALNLRNQNAVLRTQMLVLSKNARLIRMTEILVREWGWWEKGLVGLVYKAVSFPRFFTLYFFFFFLVFSTLWFLTAGGCWPNCSPNKYYSLLKKLWSY